MASRRTESELTPEVRAQLVAAGLCPFCTRAADDAGIAPRETLVDHCLRGQEGPRGAGEPQHGPCRAGWLTCTDCGAYGPIDGFVEA
jgi:hypothetical protein